MNVSDIRNQANEAARILLSAATPAAGDICVIGCSTSEISGARIGSASSSEIAAAVMDGLLPPLTQAGVFVAVQGCEHINRALCVSRACMETYDLQQVWVEPWLHAGGAFATEAFSRFSDCVMVEDLRARAALGLDVGGTLIGMHLRPVVVPIHTDLRRIGEANLILARSRPKYVGGPRARYVEVLNAH